MQLRPPRPRLRLSILLPIACALAAPAAASAVSQRSSLNPSFEQPILSPPAPALVSNFVTSIGATLLVDQTWIAGWKTSHPALANICAAGLACAPIELWSNGFLGVSAAHGNVFAEVSAITNSRLYQDLCLSQGESVKWAFSHRGRLGLDNARLVIGGTTLGSGTIVTQVQTGGAGALGTVVSGSATATADVNGWTRYSGTYTYTGASGNTQVGFEAVGSLLGLDLSIGNLVDNVDVSVAPYVDVASGTSADLESLGGNLPGVRVVGKVPLGGLTIPLTVTGGSATQGSDFTIPASMTVPAGNYDGSTSLPLPIAVANDSVVEGNETIDVTLGAGGTAYLLGNTQTCGAAAQTTATFTIKDDEPTANGDALTTPHDSTVVVDVAANDLPGASGGALDPTSVRVQDPADGAYKTSVTISGEGTYTVDATTGAVTFDPLPSFSGTAVVTYRIGNSGGTSQAALTTTVKAAPVANADVGAAVQNISATIDLLANDVTSGAALDPLSVRLKDPADGVYKLGVTISGQGTYVVNPLTGKVTFTPLPAFSGTATPIAYRVADADGVKVSSTVSFSVGLIQPVASAAAPTAVSGAPTIFDVLASAAPGAATAPIDPTSVRLRDPADGVYKTSVVISGEGTYLVNPVTGKITFTALATFVGAATPVTYRIADTNGTTATETIGVRVTAAVPTVTPAPAGGSSPTIVIPTNGNGGSNPTTALPSTVQIYDPADGLWKTTVTIPGEGTYVVDPTTGNIRFTPSAGSSGNSTIRYRAADINGRYTQSIVNPQTKPGPKLTIVKRYNRSSVRQGGLAKVSISVHNIGDETATDVIVCDLPGTYFGHPGIKRQTALTTGGYLTHGRLCWTVPAIRPGLRVAFGAIVRVSRTAPTKKLVGLARVDYRNALPAQAAASVMVLAAAASARPSVTG